MPEVETPPPHRTERSQSMTALVSRVLLVVNLRSIVHFLSAIAISGALLAYIQFASPNIVGNDGYHHIKMAELTLQQGLPLPFPWLPLTILDEHGYSDRHMLLHVLQAPFTAFADLGLASKWAAVTLAVFACCVFYFSLLRTRCAIRLFWLLVLFASSHPFLYRYEYGSGAEPGVGVSIDSDVSDPETPACWSRDRGDAVCVGV